MKILMIAPTPFMADRGCHTQLLLEVQAIQSLGHEVLVCTYGLGRDVPEVKTRRCWVFPWYKKLEAGPSYTKILLLPLLFFTTIKAIRKMKPDIVHAHLHEGALIAWFCRCFFKSPQYLFDMQGSLVVECLQHGFIKKDGIAFKILILVESWLSKTFTVVTKSNSLASHLKQLGVDKNNTFIIGDCVDTNLFRPKPADLSLIKKFEIDLSTPRLLYVGLLESYQGVDHLLFAFKFVLSHLKNTQLLIIGYPNEEIYRRKCSELGIESSVKFLGRVNYFDLPRYLTLADITVAPKISETEGDGKIFNYMAMGTCTVAFDRYVSRDILGDTGIFAELKNSGDLAKKIIWAFENPIAAKELGQKARARSITHFSYEIMGRKLEAVYKHISSQSRQPNLEPVNQL